MLDLADFDRQLRSVLLPEPDSIQAVAEDGAEAAVFIRAAVLVPIVLQLPAPTLLLTQRAEHLKDHAGQISFPGGRVEPEDNGAVDTALREAEEEIGLMRSEVEVIGFLPEYRTGTGFSVVPVVGFVRPPLELWPDPTEVAEIFEVPLEFLLDPANHKLHSLHYRGRRGRYYAMPYGDRYIWGATAGMIRSLYEHLAGWAPQELGADGAGLTALRS